jgi:hypothetical protein
LAGIEPACATEDDAPVFYQVAVQILTQQHIAFLVISCCWVGRIRISMHVVPREDAPWIYNAVAAP